ncbi:MAG: UPF0175 family protein [Bacteroidota bacterium]
MSNKKDFVILVDKKIIFIKKMAMTLELKGIELDSLEMSVDEFTLEIAVLLYSQGKLSMGKANKLVNMNRILFQEELGKRKIPVSYDEAELNADLTTLEIQ